MEISYGIYISQLLRFAREFLHVTDFNLAVIKNLTQSQAIGIIHSANHFQNFTLDTINWSKILCQPEETFAIRNF